MTQPEASRVTLRAPDPVRDFEAVLATVRACEAAIVGEPEWSPEELREEWDDLDLAHDAWLAVVDARIAGVMHRYDLRGGRVLADGYVHPELTGLGVGSALLAAVEGRARELAETVPAGVRVTVETAHLVGDPRAPALFSGRGYERVRTFFRMVVRLGEEPPAARVPGALELRPLDPDAHGPAVQALVNDAFVHEWGHVARPYAEWRERAFGVEQFDPGLCPAAWDGDDLVGVSLNYAKRLGDWGWIGTLAVHPDHRRRGLGLALLHESFRRFHVTGERVVALGVDSENPTGATRLYERAGMHVKWRADVWEKVVRP